jgi:hypothetical protein
MSTAGNKPKNITFTKLVGKNATAFVKGVGVFFSTTTAGALIIDVAVAGSKAIGVLAQDAATGDGVTPLEVALLCGAGTLKVKASGTVTAGEYAKCGTDGFENLTVGGGSTAAHCCGVFLETGVDGDFVEMMPIRMPAVIT